MNQKKNLTGMATVVLLHVVLLAAFLHGSKLTVFHSAPPVIDLVPNLDPPKPKTRDLQVDEPTLSPPTRIVVPEPPTDIPIEKSTITGTTERPPEQPPTVVTHDGGGVKVAPSKAAPAVVAAVVDASACTKPDYPKTSLRNGDTGTVMLALLIGTDGKVADSRIERTSGFRDLDRAAQAGLSLCKFKPGTVDGVAQQSWTRMQYVWSLND
ncbi:TonB family protein [Duganella sp. FT135W]|uniref:TonB family protein n=1 Tax=Duganella flavida TaxID=2692175 RepID=A0A6L8KHR2_9BURK|nr:energy transducer TonB [Duganella flavida]MYM25728.1 TonB family protein [Duganella flavida]